MEVPPSMQVAYHGSPVKLFCAPTARHREAGYYSACDLFVIHLLDLIYEHVLFMGSQIAKACHANICIVTRTRYSGGSPPLWCPIKTWRSRQRSTEHLKIYHKQCREIFCTQDKTARVSQRDHHCSQRGTRYSHELLRLCNSNWSGTGHVVNSGAHIHWFVSLHRNFT